MIFKIIPNFLNCYSSIILLDVLGSFVYEIFLDISYKRKIDFFFLQFFFYIYHKSDIKTFSKMIH